MGTPSDGQPQNDGDKSRRPRSRRGWMQQVETSVTSLEAKLAMVRDRPPPADQTASDRDAICEGVRRLLHGALKATRGDEPPYRRFSSWWRGANIEAGFRMSHQAEAELAKLYTDAEV